MKLKTQTLVLLILSVAFTTLVSSQEVFTTKTGEKYHKSTCRYLKYSKYKIELEKAIQLGYDPCSVCKPPTKVSNTNNTTSSLKESTETKTTTKNPTVSSKKAVATQCTGKTKAGNRCKRMTKNSNGRCYQH